MVIQRVAQSCAAVLRPSPDDPAPGSLGQAIFQGLALSVREILQGCRFRRPQHGAHRGGHGGRRHHRRHRDADRPQQPVHRGHRDHLPGQRGADAAADSRHQPDPGHGPPHHRQLHRHGDPDRACHRHPGRAGGPGDSGAGGPSVRVLLRHPRRRHAAGGPRGLRGLGHRRLRSHQDRHPGVYLRPAHGDPAVRVHLQPGAAADSRRQAQTARSSGSPTCSASSG